MQGVFTAEGNRFPTKKSLREELAEGGTAYLEATSFFGNEYDGPVNGAPNGTYYVVGPDPHTSRKWYAQLVVTGAGARII